MRLTGLGVVGLVATALIASACGGASGRADAPEWQTVRTPGGHQLRLAVFRPRGAPPHRVVLVLHGDDGFRQTYLDLAQRFSDRGFLAVAGCWFAGRARTIAYMDPPLDCPAAPPHDQPQLWPASIASLAQSTDQLARDAAAQGPPIGVLGNAAGALEAISAAASRSDIGAVVAVGAPYSASTPVPGSPLLLLHGQKQGTVAMSAQALNAALEYERRVRGQDVPVESHVYDETEYGFLAVRPDLLDDVIARSTDFFTRYLGS